VGKPCRLVDYAGDGVPVVIDAAARRDLLEILEDRYGRRSSMQRKSSTSRCSPTRTWPSGLLSKAAEDSPFFRTLPFARD